LIFSDLRRSKVSRGVRARRRLSLRAVDWGSVGHRSGEWDETTSGVSELEFADVAWTRNRDGLGVAVGLDGEANVFDDRAVIKGERVVASFEAIFEVLDSSGAFYLNKKVVNNESERGA
jgi:hypothetical protein